jgi:hypothetical protein
MKRTAIAFALVSVTSLGLANTSQAMSLPAQSALKEAVPSHTTEVYWRRGGGWWGAGIGLGIAAGALTAAALTSRPYWGGGYWGAYPGYAYAPAGYDYGYSYAPAYDYGYDNVPAYSYADEPAYAYGPAYSYTYAPAYSYGAVPFRTYVRPRAHFAYGQIGPRVRYGSAWASGARYTYSSGPRYRAVGPRTTQRVVNRRR